MPKTDAPVVSVQANLPGASAEEIETHDHQAHRGSGQHHQRHRRAARLVGSGQLARHHQLHARARHRIGRRRTSATSWPRSSTSSRATRGRCRSRRWIPTRSRFSASRCSGRARAKELTEIAEKRVKQELETVKDVGSVGYNGERKREIQLLLNADRLNAYGLTVDQVRTAVSGRTSRFPAASSPPARPTSRCGRWAASRTSRTSTASSISLPRRRIGHHVRATSDGCRTRCRRCEARRG